MRCQLERIAELEREVKRLKQVSRCAGHIIEALGVAQQGLLPVGLSRIRQFVCHGCKSSVRMPPLLCRLSGAFAITRRQSLGPSGSADMGSPFNLSPLGRSDAEEVCARKACCLCHVCVSAASGPVLGLWGLGSKDAVRWQSMAGALVRPGRGRLIPPILCLFAAGRRGACAVCVGAARRGVRGTGAGL